MCNWSCISAALRQLFIKVWRSGMVPTDWRDGIIITLYKRKGSKNECVNYLPISLLRFLERYLLTSFFPLIQPLLNLRRRPQQSGFTACRFTIDAILALRLLSEIHREFERPLTVAYLAPSCKNCSLLHAIIAHETTT